MASCRIQEARRSQDNFQKFIINAKRKKNSTRTKVTQRKKGTQVSISTHIPAMGETFPFSLPSVMHYQLIFESTMMRKAEYLQLQRLSLCNEFMPEIPRVKLQLIESSFRCKNIH